jgi:dienelactone hydrolase
MRVSQLLRRGCQLAGVLLLGLATGFGAAAAEGGTGAAADQALAAYFREETTRLSGRCLADIRSQADWTARRELYRRQLLEMLGLWPLPERADLRAVVTGRSEHDGFALERLHFQSLPGLYVTGDLYLPVGQAQPVPAILYVCGHGQVVKNGVSYGNKVAYHQHGIWFARHGYVCLLIDTVQLGEIQGVHHGTYRLGQWWWNARGYTPAGVETWNGMRALDYLASRPEVDRQRLGMTGRSGGGAYTWYVAAVDDRVKVAAPVAGITDLENHIVDGTVEGHCDCMFMVNTYRWDYPQVAALLAPRPLLIANSDKDTIFPLDGVLRVHEQVRRIYQLYGATTNLGLLITEGPHKDTQDLQLPVFRWFNRFLKREDPVIEQAAVKRFEPEQLKVFAALPPDARNTNIQETFVPLAAPAPVPASVDAWRRQRDEWATALRQRSFGGWPAEVTPLNLRLVFSEVSSGLRLQAYDFTSQPGVELRLFVAQRAGLRRPRRIELTVLDETQWRAWVRAFRFAFANELNAGQVPAPARLSVPQDQYLPATDAEAFAEVQTRIASSDAAWAWLLPRGIGLTAWTATPAQIAQLRRRFMLVGQTLDGMRVWDIRRGIEATRAVKGLNRLPLTLVGEADAAVNALLAAVFEPGVVELRLTRLPASFRDGPDYLNVLRVLDVPQAVAMVAERTGVRLLQPQAGDWTYPVQAARHLAWGDDRVWVETGAPASR